MQDKTGKTKTIPSFSISGVYFPVLIILVGVLIYSNSLRGPFVFDDRPNISQNHAIHLTDFSFSSLAEFKQAILKNRRPVAVVSFALNFYLGRLSTIGYRLVNLSIHLLAAILVYLFVKFTLNLPSLHARYGKSARKIALMCSLLFVSHPVQTQAVSYIIQRMASMATLFFLMSLYFYCQARLGDGKREKAYFTGCLLAAVLALGSKENSITLPFFIVLYEYCFLQRQKPNQVGKKWFYTILGLFLVTGLLGFIYTGFNPLDWLRREHVRYPVTLGQRLLTQSRVVIYYISLLLFPLPSRLNLEHHFPLSFSLLNPPTTLIALCFIFGIIAFSIYSAKKQPLVSFALIWFWGNLVLESSLPIELIYEHRLYLPSVGFFLLVSIFFTKGIEKFGIDASKKNIITTVLLIALITPLSVMTYQRNKVWQNEVVLLEDAVKKSPKKVRPNNNLCRAYVEHGQLEKGIIQCNRLLELKPGHEGAHNNIGVAYLRQNKPKEAMVEFLEELKLRPNDATVHYNLGMAYEDQGLLEEARLQYQQALELNPREPRVRNDLGNVYLKLGDTEQAIIEFLEEIKHYPKNAGVHKKLGEIYLDAGKPVKTISHYKKSLAIDPQQAEADIIRKIINDKKIIR